MTEQTATTNSHNKTYRTARLFRNGANQAVRLPREFEFDAEEVILRQVKNGLLLTPKPRTWEEYFMTSHRLSDDFPDSIDSLPLDKREPI